MKKVVCARCGLVNLDKFVSFPHCAACGALLPAQASSQWRTLWRRPVKPHYWMLAVGSGLAALGLAIAGIARETSAGGDKPLLVYTQIPRTFAPGQTLTVQLTLDSALEPPDDNFERVSLRLSQQTQRDFSDIRVQPAPSAIERRGRGSYYLWNTLPRNSALKIVLTPRPQSGALQLQATLWAARYQQFEVRANIAKASNKVGERAEIAVTPGQNPPTAAKSKRQMARQ